MLLDYNRILFPLRRSSSLTPCDDAHLPALCVLIRAKNITAKYSVAFKYVDSRVLLQNAQCCQTTYYIFSRWDGGLVRCVALILKSIFLITEACAWDFK